MQLREDVPSPASLAPDELVELMADPHRCESAVVERKLAMIAELTDRRVAEHERTGGWTSTGVEIAESEIGAALTIARHHAGKLISIATTLRDRLPRVRQALARGDRLVPRHPD